MTRDEVAKACGLEPPIEYIKRTGRGHTTAILCDVVELASLGHLVFLLAHSQEYARRLAQEARSMATRCRIDDPLIEPRSFDWEESRELRGVRNYVVLSDHHAGR